MRSYAYIGTADKAWNFFQKIGGDYAPTMFEQLGELYNAMGKFDESIRVYRELIKLTPESMKLCNWQTEILKQHALEDRLARHARGGEGAAAPVGRLGQVPDA